MHQVCLHQLESVIDWKSPKKALHALHHKKEKAAAESNKPAIVLGSEKYRGEIVIN